MTEEERRLITDFLARVAAAGGEPVDPAADALLADLLARWPEARYRLAQTAFFLEHALAEAENRIAQLEWQLARARTGPFAGLFGGGRPVLPPPPRHAPGWRPGLFETGTGFVATAGVTAVAVLDAAGTVEGTALQARR